MFNMTMVDVITWLVIGSSGFVLGVIYQTMFGGCVHED
jgi:hypothetical protein